MGSHGGVPWGGPMEGSLRPMEPMGPHRPCGPWSPWGPIGHEAHGALGDPMGIPWSRIIDHESPMVTHGHPRSPMVTHGHPWSEMVQIGSDRFR